MTCLSVGTSKNVKTLPYRMLLHQEKSNATRFNLYNDFSLLTEALSIIRIDMLVKHVGRPWIHGHCGATRP